jgi:Zn-dependent M28 family amino/carboxypeptidase
LLDKLIFALILLIFFNSGCKAKLPSGDRNPPTHLQEYNLAKQFDNQNLYLVSKLAQVPASKVNLEPTIQLSKKFDANKAFQYVADLVDLAPRIVGSAGETQARNYLTDKFTNFGYQVKLQSFSNTAGIISYNVIAQPKNFNPSQPWLVIGGHYDSMNVPAAEDNASGVGTILELANLYSNARLAYQIIFIAFSSEEKSNPTSTPYLGSAAYVASLSKQDKANLIGYINLDMIGWGKTINSIGNMKWADAWLINLTMRTAKELNIPFSAYQGNSVRLSDHQSFEKIGVASVSIGDKHYPFTHTEADSIDKISRRKLATVGKLVSVLLWKINKKELHH